MVQQSGTGTPSHIAEAVREAVAARGEPSLVKGRRPVNHRGIRAPSQFEQCHFEARLHEIKHMPSEETRVILLARPEDIEEASKLKYAYPVGLEIIVVRKRST